jgi:hypothetical protein
MPSLFADLMKVGMAQALETAGTTVLWVFEGEQERPVTCLVSEENVVEKTTAGGRQLVKNRGLTFTEDETQTLFAVKRPSNRDRFRVTDGTGYIEYAVHETVSRADGGTTIIGERIERRERVKDGFHGPGS